MSAQAEHVNHINSRNNGSQHPQNDVTTNMNTGNLHSQHQPPNVRHIPIFVEGRDEPLINKNMDTASKPYTDLPNSKSSGGIFDRVKNFPTINRMQSSAQQRSNSPHRTVPMNVHRSTSAGSTHTDIPSRQEYTTQQQQQQPHKQYPQQQPSFNQHQMPPQQTPSNDDAAAAAAASPQPAPNQNAEIIAKIQDIQRDVLFLMDEVEKFTGCSRKDRQYLYLDEMLTQNLLKLDTIDTDGKENIKKARREAIKCINTCIGVLEAKADTNGERQYQKQLQQQHQQQNNENHQPQTGLVKDSFNNYDRNYF